MGEARKVRQAQLPHVDQWRLAEVTLFETALGHDVTLTLEPGRTILVGWNGAGKSLLLEAFNEAATLAVHRHIVRAPSTLRFTCELRANDERLVYEFVQNPKKRLMAEDDAGGRFCDWREKCWSSKRTLWEVTDGVAKVGSHEFKLERGIGLLAAAPPTSVAMPPELRVVRSLLSRVRRIQAGVPRRFEPRSPLFLLRSSETSSKPDKAWTVNGRLDHRIEIMTRSIMNWHESDPERFKEYAAVGERIGLWNTLNARVLQQNVKGLGTDSEASDLGIVSADNINFACLSDGTLRAAEILCYLVGSVSSVLLIEEPETSIHPGLLRRLLNEVEAYSADKQIVISSHSPDVVSKATPSEIRLVRRRDQKTTVNGLSESDTNRIREYLCEEGRLGDFIFGGGAEQDE